MSTVWKQNKERSMVFILKFIRWFALTFGRKVTKILLYPICLYYFFLSPKAKNNIKKFLTKALNRKVRFSDLYKHYYTFATVLLDRVYSLTDTQCDFKITTHGLDALLDIQKQGSGVILMGAHLGSFELMRVLATKNQLALKVLMHLEDSQQVIKLLHELNPAIEQTIITMGNPGSILETHEWLKNNGAIGILADRVYHEDKTTITEFLGAPARFALGPFRLAKLTNTPCLFICAVYDGKQGYDIYFEKLDFTAFDSTEQMLQKYLQKLEYYAKKYPYNWFNFYDYWGLN